MATCRLCSKIAPLTAVICARCVESYGRKTALFLARAQVDPDFANATLARLEPAVRERFLRAISRRYLTEGPGLRKAAPRPEVGHRRTVG
jgi:hypothetical protein